jgi:hypothetical protein
VPLASRRKPLSCKGVHRQQDRSVHSLLGHDLVWQRREFDCGTKRQRCLVAGVCKPELSLTPQETFPIDVTLDGQAQFHLFGTALAQSLVIAILPNNAAIDQFRKSSLMVAVAKGATLQFALNSTGSTFADNRQLRGQDEVRWYRQRWRFFDFVAKTGNAVDRLSIIVLAQVCQNGRPVGHGIRHQHERTRSDEQSRGRQLRRRYSRQSHWRERRHLADRVQRRDQ